MLHAQGALEELLPLCTDIADATGDRPLTTGDRDDVAAIVTDLASHGLRLLAVAERRLPTGDEPQRREDVERDLTLLGVDDAPALPGGRISAAASAKGRR